MTNEPREVTLAREVVRAPLMKVWLRIDTGTPSDVHFVESEVYVVTAETFDLAQQVFDARDPEGGAS